MTASKRDGSFNPTLVRLRRSFERTWAFASYPFQSHAGSIEAHCCASNIQARCCCFNPTLVRLRRRGHAAHLGDLAVLFQSHAGSIEAK